jgi:putative spermidine/putrescine transport system permease protein
MLPALLFIFTLHAAPLLRLISLSFGHDDLSLDSYRELFGMWSYGATLFRTLRISATVVVGCLIWGFPIAYVLAFASPDRRVVLWLLVLLPSCSSILVRNFAWIYLLRDGGMLSTALGWMTPSGLPVQLLYNEIGVVIAMVSTLLPFMIYPIYLSLSAQSSVLRDAAASLGASPTRTFASITLPLSSPGVRAGAIFVFATAAGFFVTPALLGGGRVFTSATFIAQQIEEFLNWPLAAAASMMLLVLLALAGSFYLRSTITRADNRNAIS